MARPADLPRQALQHVLRSAPDGVTWRMAAERAGLPPNLVRRTLDNMARSGAAVKAGYVRVPGTNRPAVVFKPAAPAASRSPAQDLQTAMRGWVTSF